MSLEVEPSVNHDGSVWSWYFIGPCICIPACKALYCHISLFVDSDLMHLFWLNNKPCFSVTVNLCHLENKFC